MAWGGRRPGSGRKPPGQARSKPVRPSLRAEPKLTPRTVPAEVKEPAAIDQRVLTAMLPQIEEISRQYAMRKARSQATNPFKLPEFPAKAKPPAEMAMDAMLGQDSAFGQAGSAWLAGSEIAGMSADGLMFLGYTYLSELAQRPEYRVMSETIADDMTREWISFDVIGDEKQQLEDRARDPEGYDERLADPDERKKRVKNAGKTDRVKELEDDQLRLEVKDRFYEQARNDGFFGRSHLFLDIRTNATTDVIDGAELKTPIGNSRDETSKSKVPKGSFHGLRTIEPVWTYPMMYNAINPLRADWYNPQTWYVMGQEIHGSRLQTFIGHPVPDMLKPAYAFGGLSLSQMAKPYVDRWLTTVTSVNQLVHSFSVMVLMTDLSTMMQPGSVSALLARVAMFNMLRDNQGTFVVNKNTEDFKNVSAQLSGLHELQAQAQEHMASINRIPLVKFTGIQPAGLNASSEGEIEVYDDTIAAYQSRFADPNLRRIINFEMLSLWGEVDTEITHRWNPLRQITDAERGQKEKDDADRDQKYVDMGAISPEEVRKRVINDKELPYTGLDPDDIPVRPDPMGGEGGEGGEFDDGERPPEGQNDNREPGKDAVGANDEDPFGASDEWSEGDHPRAPDGKFGSGGGSTSKSAKKTSGSSKPSSALKPSDLKKVGSQMGSNEGGVFEDKSGERFYVKRPASKAHVANERAAARLYQLAGVNTLTYRDVEGGNHVATKLEKLDKNRISQLSPEERKEAAKDFIVHAWLSNWDAAGTGGDNQGVLNGKVTTLDVGGSLRYRAQGGPKGSAFGPKVSEIDTMRNPKMSPDAAKLFGDMSDADLKASASRVTNLSDSDIRSAAQDDALADLLIERRDDIAKRFGLYAHDMAHDDAQFEESKHPRAPDGKFTSGGGGGSSSSAPKFDPVLLSKPPIAGANYRKALVKAIAVADPDEKVVLTAKLAASWEKTLSNTIKKGDLATAEKIAVKIQKLTGAKPSVPKAPPPEEKKDLGSMAGQKAPPLVPPKPKMPAPTAAQIAAAKKTAGLKLQFVPGDKPETTAFQNDAASWIKDFNSKWENKPVETMDQVQEKIADFNVVKDMVNAIAGKEAAYKAENAKKLAEEAAKAAALAKQKAVEEAAKAAAKNKRIMEELGISDKQAEAVAELAKMLGSKSGDIVEHFKGYAEKAKAFGYPISGFQCALIMNYSNGGYHEVNAKLRSGSWTPAQHMYVSMVNKALMEMPKHTGILTRNTSLTQEQIAMYKEGHIIQEPSFLSTSTGSVFSGNVQYKVTATGKRGASIQKLSHYKNEKEVLFAARTFFKVNKVEKSGGKTIIHMEEWEEH